ncbi:MAG: phospholipase [Acidobacteriota bacterium]|nr:phospholipase [Acidobacteriota bacterium]
MQSRTIAVTTHGRYLIEAPPGPEPHPLLVGFHGYAENAERHLDALGRLPGSSAWVRVAVQGLHRFYDRRNERVLAGWMTRQDRELAIADNIDYVRRTVEAIRAEGAGRGPLVYAGFSQGVAMAYRAAAFAGHACVGLIALGGDVPPDLDAAALAALPPVLLGRGRADTWYSAAKMEEDLTRLRAQRVAVEPVVFDGGHEWTGPFLDAAGRFLTRVHQTAASA